MFTVSKLGTWNNIDREILVFFAESEKFYPCVFYISTCKNITFFLATTSEQRSKLNNRMFGSESNVCYVRVIGKNEHRIRELQHTNKVSKGKITRKI